MSVELFKEDTVHNPTLSEILSGFQASEGLTLSQILGTPESKNSKKSVGQIIKNLGAGSEISIQGWQSTLVFSASDENTVAWASGTITLLDGTEYSIGGGNTGNMSALTYIYLDVNASVTVLQTSTTASDAVGRGRILIAVGEDNAGSDATFQAFGGIGGILLKAANIAADSITANEIAANSITANEMNVSTLSSITANIGSITAGSLDAVTITAATITGSTLQTGTVGANVDITASRLRVRTGSTEVLYLELGSYGGVSGLKDTSGNAIGSWAVDDSSGNVRLKVNNDNQLFDANNYVFVGSGNIYPASDDSISLGTTNQRWSDVRSVLINGADYGFDNGWWLTEHYTLDIEEEGLAFLDTKHNLVMFIGKSGVYAHDTKDIKGLKYTKRNLEERKELINEKHKREHQEA